MRRRLLTRWRRTCNRSPLAGSSREYPNTIPTPPTILSRRSAPASGASALIRESERMHTPGQFGPPAISAFAPLCTKRERLQIGTGNRVRTGELPIRGDQFLAIRAEKLSPTVRVQSAWRRRSLRPTAGQRPQRRRLARGAGAGGRPLPGHRDASDVNCLTSVLPARDLLCRNPLQRDFAMFL